MTTDVKAEVAAWPPAAKGSYSTYRKFAADKLAEFSCEDLRLLCQQWNCAIDELADRIARYKCGKG